MTRRAWTAVLIAAAWAASGCETASGPEAEGYDPARARAALVAALEAWKRGESKGLSRRSPPIRFVDDDLVQGFRLDDYEIEEPDAPKTPRANVAVILMLRDPKGRVVRREATYQVALEPAPSVLRSDL